MTRARLDARAREAQGGAGPQPRTKAALALRGDYYANNDARKGVGYSFGNRLAQVESEAVTTFLQSEDAERLLADAIVKERRGPHLSCTVDHRDSNGNPIGCPDAPKQQARAILASMKEAMQP